MSTIKEETAVRRIASMCAKREHSRADAYDILKKWGFDGKVIEGMLDALETGGFIDEERFCRAYISDKFRFSKWGRHKIAQGLYLKKIPTEMAQRYLKEIDEEEYMHTLKGLINSKKRSVSAKDKKDQNAKLIRFAISRGFEMQYILQCLEISDEE